MNYSVIIIPPPRPFFCASAFILDKAGNTEITLRRRPFLRASTQKKKHYYQIKLASSTTTKKKKKPITAEFIRNTIVIIYFEAVLLLLSSYSVFCFLSPTTTYDGVTHGKEGHDQRTLDTFGFSL